MIYLRDRDPLDNCVFDLTDPVRVAVNLLRLSLLIPVDQGFDILVVDQCVFFVGRNGNQIWRMPLERLEMHKSVHIG